MVIMQCTSLLIRDAKGRIYAKVTLLETSSTFPARSASLLEKKFGKIPH